MSKLSQQIEALGQMSPAELRASWRDTFRHPPPDMTSELMARAIAYRLQERQHGGLPSRVRRQIAKLARRAARTGSFDTPQDISLKPGTRLVREWQGRTLSVTVCDSGFELDGRQYGSLTQITREVTGTSWSGPRFFGLKAKKSPPSRAKVQHG